LLLPPGWDASLSQGYPQQYVVIYNKDCKNINYNGRTVYFSLTI